MHAIDRAIAELAGRQDNLITRDQLLATGLGRGAIAHRLSTGRWQRVHPGVYLVAPAPLDPHARARAALLACGADAVVSHTTAAGIWDILPDDEAVHVTVPGRNAGPRHGVCVHRTAALHHEDTAIRDRLRLTSPARTIWTRSATGAPTHFRRAPRSCRWLDESRLGHGQDDRSVIAVAGHDVRAVRDTTVEDRSGELLLKRAPDVALERPSAELGVEALTRQP
jgi:Transcriptional regulator, AbiEi antitoxin